MRTDERSRDVFEEVVGYEKPPLPPLPEVDDYASLARQGFIRLTPTSRRLIRAALRAVRYEAFHATLPDRVEDILRRTNMRESRLFAPAFTATTALADDPRDVGALDRAATLVLAAHSLCGDVMSGRLSADTHRGRPLEMGQYPNLFSTTALVDGRARLFKGKRFDLVGILVRRRIYVLDLSGEGELTAAAIATALAAAVADAAAPPQVDDDASPGILSAAKTRTLTAALRAMDAGPSAGSLAALRECFFVLCLDLDAHPESAGESARLAHAANPANRWYLASLQLVVYGNAKAAAMFSFLAYLDGNVMARSGAEIWRRAAKAPLNAPNGGSLSHRSIPAPRKLTFDVNRRLARRAWRQVRRVQDDQGATFTIQGVGRPSFATCGLDPVGAFVLALALATKRRAGRVPSILQLVTISKYRCVPIGAAVVTTPEVRAFLACMEGRGDRVKAGTLLDAAIASQSGECRRERDRLSLRWPLEAFIRSRRGLGRVFTLGILGAALAALKVTGSLGKKDVVISHPEIFSEIPVFGRPGVRLPYVNHFGLHYQIYEGETVLTFMPGLKWRTPNAVFTRDIERAVHDVLEVAATRR